MQLEDQVTLAIKEVKSLFNSPPPAKASTLPPDATLESLWAVIVAQQEELTKLKGKKRGGHPKIEDAVKLLITNPMLAQIPIPMVANIIRDVFNLYGVKSACSEGSVRWYISQKSLIWDVVNRQLPRIPTLMPRTQDEPTSDAD